MPAGVARLALLIAGAAGAFGLTLRSVNAPLPPAGAWNSVASDGTGVLVGATGLSTGAFVPQGAGEFVSQLFASTDGVNWKLVYTSAGALGSVQNVGGYFVAFAPMNCSYPLVYSTTGLDDWRVSAVANMSAFGNGTCVASLGVGLSPPLAYSPAGRWVMPATYQFGGSMLLQPVLLSNAYAGDLSVLQLTITDSAMGGMTFVQSEAMFGPNSANPTPNSSAWLAFVSDTDGFTTAGFVYCSDPTFANSEFSYTQYQPANVAGAQYVFWCPDTQVLMAMGDYLVSTTNLVNFTFATIPQRQPDLPVTLIGPVAYAPSTRSYIAFAYFNPEASNEGPVRSEFWSAPADTGTAGLISGLNWTYVSGSYLMVSQGVSMESIAYAPWLVGSNTGAPVWVATNYKGLTLTNGDDGARAVWAVRAQWTDPNVQVTSLILQTAPGAAWPSAFAVGMYSDQLSNTQGFEYFSTPALALALDSADTDSTISPADWTLSTLSIAGSGVGDSTWASNLAPFHADCSGSGNGVLLASAATGVAWFDPQPLVRASPSTADPSPYDTWTTLNASGTVWPGVSFAGGSWSITGCGPAPGQVVVLMAQYQSPSSGWVSSDSGKTWRNSTQSFQGWPYYSVAGGTNWMLFNPSYHSSMCLAYSSPAPGTGTGTGAEPLQWSSGESCAPLTPNCTTYSALGWDAYHSQYILSDQHGVMQFSTDGIGRNFSAVPSANLPPALHVLPQQFVFVRADAATGRPPLLFAIGCDARTNDYYDFNWGYGPALVAYVDLSTTAAAGDLHGDGDGDGASAEPWDWHLVDLPSPVVQLSPGYAELPGGFFSVDTWYSADNSRVVIGIGGVLQTTFITITP